MPRVYPRAPEQKTDGVGIDSVLACALRVIQAKEDGLSRAEAAGVCLAGSDAVLLFNQLWEQVDDQVRSARAVSPADYDTVTDYKAAVSAAAPLLDATLWYNGLKAETGTATFTELTAKIEELAESKGL